jgi:hypothetical protein
MSDRKQNDEQASLSKAEAEVLMNEALGVTPVSASDPVYTAYQSIAESVREVTDLEHRVRNRTSEDAVAEETGLIAEATRVLLGLSTPSMEIIRKMSVRYPRIDELMKYRKQHVLKIIEGLKLEKSIFE